MKVTKEEIEYLRRQREFFDTTRNTLITFLFTTVMTVLGIAISIDLSYWGSFLCLIPYLLIFPLTGRIVYYRVADAHINTYLKVFAPESATFQLGAEKVSEEIWKGLKGRGYPLVAWLVNHEMVFLGIACTLVFCLKHFVALKINPLCSRLEMFWLVFSLVLICLVFAVMHSTYKYDTLCKEYEDKWLELKLKHNEEENETTRY